MYSTMPLFEIPKPNKFKKKYIIAMPGSSQQNIQ